MICLVLRRPIVPASFPIHLGWHGSVRLARPNAPLKSQLPVKTHSMMMMIFLNPESNMECEMGGEYLSESQCFFNVLVPNQFNEVLLLQVEEEVTVRIQQVGMKLVDQRCGFLDFPCLNAVTDFYALVQPF